MIHNFAKLQITMNLRRSRGLLNCYLSDNYQSNYFFIIALISKFNS